MGDSGDVARLEQLSNEIQGLALNVNGEVNQVHCDITRLLPVEIICSIFYFSIHYQRFRIDMWPLPRNEWLGPSLKLGSICKEWRQIAWDTPKLWTNVVVCLDRRKPPAEHHDLLRDWISRSKTLPLRVLVHSEQYMGPDPDSDDEEPGEGNDGVEYMHPDDYYPLLDIAAHCSSRWKEIMVLISMTSTRYLFGKVNDMSNIDTLGLYSTSWAMDLSDLTHYQLFRDEKGRGLSPRYLNLNGIIGLTQLNIDWTRLTHFDLDAVCGDLETFLYLLRLSPLLESCKLQIYQGSIHTWPATFVVHPCLRHLSFAAPTDRKAGSIFATTTLPNLTDLDLEIIPGSTRDPDQNNTHITQAGSNFFKALTEFSVRSSHSLRKLTLTINWEFPFDEVDTLLQCLPSITHLRVSTEELTFPPEPLFRRLAQTWAGDLNNSASFLPSLQKLELQISESDWDYVFPWYEIFDLFGPLPLNTIDINNPKRRPLNSFGVLVDRFRLGEYRVPPDFLPRLLDFRSMGIDIQYVDNEDEDVDLILSSIID